MAKSTSYRTMKEFMDLFSGGVVSISSSRTKAKLKSCKTNSKKGSVAIFQPIWPVGQVRLTARYCRWWKFNMRPPGIAAWLFDKVEY